MPALRAIIVWSVLFGFYLLLAGSTSATEVAAGIGATSLATLLILAAHDRERRHLTLRPPASVLFRPLAALVTDSALVGSILLKAILRRPEGAVGSVSRQPFIGGGKSPRDAGRRGLVTIMSSLAPNGFVLHVPGDDDTLVMHRLAPVRASRDREWPV